MSNVSDASQMLRDETINRDDDDGRATRRRGLTYQACLTYICIFEFILSVPGALRNSWCRAIGNIILHRKR